MKGHRKQQRNTRARRWHLTDMMVWQRCVLAGLRSCVLRCCCDAVPGCCLHIILLHASHEESGNKQLYNHFIASSLVRFPVGSQPH